MLIFFKTKRNETLTYYKASEKRHKQKNNKYFFNLHKLKKIIKLIYGELYDESLFTSPAK